MTTHIRTASDQTVTYCGHPPRETISLRHYTEGLLEGPVAKAKRGQVERLPDPICPACEREVGLTGAAGMWLYRRSLC